MRPPSSSFSPHVSPRAIGYRKIFGTLANLLSRFGLGRPFASSRALALQIFKRRARRPWYSASRR